MDRSHNDSIAWMNCGILFRFERTRKDYRLHTKLATSKLGENTGEDITSGDALLDNSFKDAFRAFSLPKVGELQVANATISDESTICSAFRTTTKTATAELLAEIARLERKARADLRKINGTRATNSTLQSQVCDCLMMKLP